MKLALITGILFFAVAGLFIERMALQARLASRDAEVAFLRKLPSIMDIQERLNEIEPTNPIPVDGKVSNDWQNSKTQTKWDRIVFNKYAVKFHDPNFYGAVATAKEAKPLSCD